MAFPAAGEEAAAIVDASEIQGLKENVYQAKIVPFHTYAPAVIRIPPGTTVVWTNEDVAEHNVRVLTAEKSWMKGKKNELTHDLVGPLAYPGEKVAITFHKEGVYRYMCDPHPYMQAHVVVERGAKLERPEPGTAGAEQAKGEEDLAATPSPRDAGAAPRPKTGAAAAAAFARDWRLRHKEGGDRLGGAPSKREGEGTEIGGPR